MLYITDIAAKAPSVQEDHMQRTVRYSKKVIVNTSDRYSRPHIEACVEDTIREHESPSEALERVRRTVDKQLLDDIYRIQFGEEKQRMLISSRKERERRECIANTYGLGDQPNGE
jgi:hypothetical protein